MISLRRILDGLHEFFFKPISPINVAIYRIALGVLVIINAFIYWPLRFVWFSETGTLTFAGSHMVAAPPRLNMFEWFAPTDGLATAVLAIHIVAAVMMTAGLFTRISTAVVFLTLTSLHHRNALVLNSGDTVMRLMVCYMFFAPAGRAFSLDRLFRVMRGKEGRELGKYLPWAQRVMQIQLGIVYFTTFLFKIDGSMWLDGTSIYYTSRLTDFQRFPVPIVFDHLFTIKLVTYASLLTEFAMGVLVWFEELTYPVLVAGLLLHLGIDWTMNIPLFEWLTATPYILFVAPEDTERWLKKGRELAGRYIKRLAPQPATATVFFDGACGLCTATSNVLSIVDPFGRLELVDFRAPGVASRFTDFDRERADREMLLRTAGGEYLGGFDAFRWLTARLPLLWPLALLLRLPGAAAIGRRVYPLVARNRHKLLGVRCETGVCRTA